MAPRKSKHLLSLLARLQPFTAADPTRLSLCYVCVEETRAWATDGHRALILRRRDGDDGLAEGCYLDGGRAAAPGPTMPQIDAVIPPAETPVRFTLGAPLIRDLRELVAALRPKVQATVRFGKTGTVLLIGDRKFAVVLDPTPSSKIVVNARYLIDALDALSSSGSLDVKFGDPCGPIRMDWIGNTAIVMPLCA